MQRIVGRRVEAAERGSEQSDRRPRQDSPNVRRVRVLELARLIQTGRDDVAQREHCHRRGNNEDRNSPQSRIESAS